MPLTLATLRGKWQAARTLAEFARHFRNYRDVFAAYRAGQRLPTLELRGGMTIEHDEGNDPILLFREVFIDRCYTGDGFYRPRPGDTVLDLGANIGMFALFLESEARGIKVHCFEPASSTRAVLIGNVGANGLADLVRVHPVAVSDRAGTVELRRSAVSGHRSLFESRFVGEETESVESIDLASALDRAGAARVDLLKIDTEGAEIEIVEGLDPPRWAEVDRVVVEFHDLFRPGCRERVTAALARGGFDSIRTISLPPHDLGIIRASRHNRTRGDH